MTRTSLRRLAASLPFLLSIAATGSPAFAADPAPLAGCAAKRQDVQTQLDYARAHKNKAQEAKLNIALKQIEENCTDEGLRREREADVSKKEKKVAERKAELEEAKAAGKNAKVGKLQKKLQSAEDELAKAQSQLSK
ncbi:DUF1090 domain-containing protein [Herbaspirillum lusitanum]|jgi:hypothetical protein|uniref:DUF1090 domain-containing protein n=1 Tax=Herbaspirillum lusitanum TaxID=213312 RepID=A0ABW9A517_9BURK